MRFRSDSRRPRKLVRTPHVCERLFENWVYNLIRIKILLGLGTLENKISNNSVDNCLTAYIQTVHALGPSCNVRIRTLNA